MLAAIKNFIANQWDREAARKRGGDWTRVPFEPLDLERRYLSVRSRELDPERLFDRQWAQTVLERALTRLQAQRVAGGKGEEFAALSGYLTSDVGDERPYREVATELGMTEVAVRAAVHRLRQRFGAELRAEVADTVGDRAAADSELRHILAMLAA